jgi:hypothetical protein
MYASGFRTPVRLTAYLGAERTGLNHFSADKCAARRRHAEVLYKRLIFYGVTYGAYGGIIHLHMTADWGRVPIETLTVVTS